MMERRFQEKVERLGVFGMKFLVFLKIHLIQSFIEN